MGEKNRIVVLAVVMALIVSAAVSMTAFTLYRVALTAEKGRLREVVQSQARLMGAIAQHEAAMREQGMGSYPTDTLLDHTLEILREARNQFKGFGATGEFTLGKRDGENINFLLRQRHYDLDKPLPIPFSSSLGEPMRRALMGQSGADIIPDYRGVFVVAAYEPVPELDLGLVAKIDLAEVRAPYMHAALMFGSASLALVGLGAMLFLYIGNPIIRRLEENERKYRTLSEDLDQEVKRKVAELQQAQRMAAIGQMVSAVSHEVRNPLQRIRMGVDTLKENMTQDKDKLEIIDEIQHGVTVLDDIIRELLEYSRPTSLKYSSVQVGELVRRALALLSHKLDKIAVSVELDRQEREIDVDPVKMSQVLVNVISNSIEAMNDGGSILISSRFLPCNGSECLEFSVSDNGPGMSEEILRRIDEPFYTSKPSGIGLGIAICKKIIEAHKGSLNVRSEPGEGTTVEITLPLRPNGQADTQAEDSRQS